MESRTSSGGSTATGAASRRGPFSGGLGIIIVLAALVAAGYSVRSLVRNVPSEEPKALAGDFICARTLKHFTYQMAPGERQPVFSPFSKERTGYPAEKCFWTRDGKAKLEPTFVLLNHYIGKKDEPTICPDCGRLVEPRNPTPPPELIAEAYARKTGTQPPPAPDGSDANR